MRNKKYEDVVKRLVILIEIVTFPKLQRKRKYNNFNILNKRNERFSSICNCSICKLNI